MEPQTTGTQENWDCTVVMAINRLRALTEEKTAEIAKDSNSDMNFIPK
jgi:hypothetical protein